MNLSEKYEFRSIRKDEADQATEIEQICFPPAETISRKDIIDRVEKIPELFLVAEDRETGKLAGYLTGLATDEEVFQDKFFTDADLRTICFLAWKFFRNIADRGLPGN